MVRTREKCARGDVEGDKDVAEDGKGGHREGEGKGDGRAAQRHFELPLHVGEEQSRRCMGMLYLSVKKLARCLSMLSTHSQYCVAKSVP